MTIELFFNGLLFLFFGYCFIDIGKVSHLPGSDPMGAALWPQIILVLLIISLAINIYGIIKKEKANSEKVVKIGGAMIKEFFTSKLFVGMVLVAALAVLLDPLGFVPATFLFLIAYGYLLGQRNHVKAVLYSLIITIILFFLFSKGLSIMLPRGIGFLREFALMLEMI
ncbi:MAG: tripartite tricarboxylate transporter TctB family protein [Oscillospiraceae bacterium]